MNMTYPVVIAAAMTIMPCFATAEGDVAAGEVAFNGKGCVGCHGVGGRTQIPANPALNGKGAEYIKNALAAYKSGAKQNATMNAMAGLLSDVDIDNVAAYLGTQG